MAVNLHSQQSKFPGWFQIEASALITDVGCTDVPIEPVICKADADGAKATTDQFHLV
jgi:hypothetical protein